MDKTITPMLIGKEREPFDSDEYLFELKMDGIRCLAFIENNKVDLRNKRNIKLLPKFPEMKDLGKYVKHDCILDGELYCFHDGQEFLRPYNYRKLTLLCQTNRPSFCLPVYD